MLVTAKHEWIARVRQSDKKLLKYNKKTALLIDNCLAHLTFESFSSVSLIFFLLLNTKSVTANGLWNHKVLKSSLTQELV